MVSQGGAGANAGKKGVAPGAQVLSFATDSAPAGSTLKTRLVDGGDRLVSQGVKIINMSAGGAVNGNGSSPATLAVDYFAFAKNIVWTKSAGNMGAPKTITIPGDCFNCITVGSTMPSPTFNQVRTTSSEGRTGDLRNKPDIVAPGTNISTPDTLPNHFAVPGPSGTSFASPHAP
jgi:hypothetical protein